VRELTQHPLALGALAAAAANLALGVSFATEQRGAAALLVVPVVAVALGALIASTRAILAYAAIAVSLLSPLPLLHPLPLGLGVNIYTPDVLVLLAMGSWVAAWLVNPKPTRPSLPATPVLRWPLLLFGLTLCVALARGHELYGTSIVNAPLRLLFYAGIAFAVTDLEPRKAYRWLVILFYGGTVWQVLVLLYGLATGTSATDQVFLSTGGERVLAGSTAMFMTGTLLLALLNLELDRRAGRTSLHLLMAGIATLALVYTFARTTFAVVAVLVPLLLLIYRRVGTRMLALTPLSVPILVLAALLIPRIDPDVYPTLRDRVTGSPISDSSFRFRQEAYEVVWAQVREEPLIGVGFGRESTFTVQGERVTIVQDPHNQFLYLWAGGGLLLLLSFVLLLAVYLADALRRFRGGLAEERRLLFWVVSLWFVFMVNSASGAILTSPSLLLVFWVLMSLPMVVRPRQETRRRGVHPGYAGDVVREGTRWS
jgi:O-antigen ligase